MDKKCSIENASGKEIMTAVNQKQAKYYDDLYVTGGKKCNNLVMSVWLRFRRSLKKYKVKKGNSIKLQIKKLHPTKTGLIDNVEDYDRVS